MKRSGFGELTKLKSGRWRARYQVPNSKPRAYVTAPATFNTKAEAATWLSRQRVDIVDGVTLPPKVLADRTTLTEYAERWLDTRLSKSGSPLRPSTMRVYRHYLDHHIAPTLGKTPVVRLTPEAVAAWWRTLDPTRPTVRARTYSFLRTVLADATADGMLTSNPCRMRGAGSVEPATKVYTATVEQLDELAAAMPERLRLAVALGTWASMRNGEVLELRRGDVTTSSIRIARGVTFDKTGAHVGPPKTTAGERVVALPPHVAQDVVEHMDRFVAADDDALLFPATPFGSEHLHQNTFATIFKRAVEQTSLPTTFRFHWLRHTGLTFAAQTGATVAELQARAGHSTPSTAMRYQHATTERDRDLAAALSALVGKTQRLRVVKDATG
ncbi:putative prophage phiRv2 integrase [Cellulomonas xylanilytica]|uniref:Putative prophage phiRv2 integrase n=1 Tax=Cellulomonas xylanilytica TaxID=233583 RepID=A0A510V281_9CELL|nr:putative prophage phiRv2 integrase [Cellulomonas xylanilytica]